MGLFLRILALLAAAATGAVTTVYFINKNSDKPISCGELLALNRKKLIKEMNKAIEETEERISPENHERKQKELEKVYLENSSKCE